MDNNNNSSNTNIEYNPTTCGNSKKMDNVYICKLQIVPCALHFNKECYLESMNRAIKSVEEYMLSVK